MTFSHKTKRRFQTHFRHILSTCVFLLFIAVQGCVTHHSLQFDADNSQKAFEIASFKIQLAAGQKAPSHEHPTTNSDLAVLLKNSLEQSGFQQATPRIPADFVVSAFSDYLPPGSLPPKPPAPPRLPDPQIIISNEELESLDPSRKEFWRIVIEVRDPTTSDLLWSAYAESSNGNHFKSSKNCRSAIDQLVQQLPR